MYFGGGKKIGERDSMARLTRKNSFPVFVIIFILANEMKKMRQLPAFSTSRWDSFFYFFFFPLDILETCVSYEEKGNSRVNFFLTEVILVHAFRSSL